ncbi:unnamed protein product [Schistosoma margrebowiei]|uniref:Uncharacterized protein n=1 Tax=Schistosoma margrebowiei TaxID=48269 RepID=A0A183LB35_9TREM|nr:unnamed protein product [Schistosoma margrebowiei]
MPRLGWTTSDMKTSWNDTDWEKATKMVIFANLCAFNKLVIDGTVFPHKRIHKAIWTSPDHTTQNQIDHICINKKFRKTMEDVRTKRGADIAADHHLLVAKMELKFKNYWTTVRTISQ